MVLGSWEQPANYAGDNSPGIFRFIISHWAGLVQPIAKIKAWNLAASSSFVAFFFRFFHLVFFVRNVKPWRKYFSRSATKAKQTARNSNKWQQKQQVELYVFLNFNQVSWLVALCDAFAIVAFIVKAASSFFLFIEGRRFCLQFWMKRNILKVTLPKKIFFYRQCPNWDKNSQAIHLITQWIPTF